MDRVDVRELCRRARISDYLEARGVELVRSGKRLKCKCPLPDHETDNTPSFYIGEFPDGGEYFKCFGCNASGNLISLVSILEKKKKGTAVRDIARSLGLSGKLLPSGQLEPASDEVVAMFCEEESASMKVATYARQFLELYGSEDAVNKVSRLYKRLDKMIELGDNDGMEAICEEMGNLLVDYGGTSRK